MSASDAHLTLAARRALNVWRQGAAEAAGFDTWEAYMDSLRPQPGDDDPHRFDQPPAEHSTRDPWPEGFQAPVAIVRLQGAVDLTWEVRLGYCRGSRKVGRGNVGTGADARWELTHVVVLQARPRGMEGQAWVSIAYAAPAVNGPLKWKHDASSAPLEPKSTLAKARGWLVQDSAVAVATVSATRQTVVPPTDMFAS